MAIATRVDSSVSPPITYQALYGAIKQAFTSITFGTQYFEDATGTVDPYRNVRKITIDAAKTYGNIYLRLRVTSGLIVGFRIYTKYEELQNVFENASDEYSSPAFVSNAAINIFALSLGNEFKGVLLIQGSTFFPICFLSPINKPIWWDMNSYPYGFINISNTFSTFSQCSLNPYANLSLVTSLNRANLSNANTLTGKRDIELGFNIYTNSNQGIAGKSSEDLASLAAVGLSRFDVIRASGVSSRDYLVINNVAGGLGVRIS